MANVTGQACPECGGEPIGVEIPGIYDGILYWSCPNGHTWHRWAPGTPLRARAERFVNRH